jgi:hypothetical protein
MQPLTALIYIVVATFSMGEVVFYDRCTLCEWVDDFTSEASGCDNHAGLNPLTGECYPGPPAP